MPTQVRQETGSRNRSISCFWCLFSEEKTFYNSTLDIPHVCIIEEFRCRIWARNNSLITGKIDLCRFFLKINGELKGDFNKCCQKKLEVKSHIKEKKSLSALALHTERLRKSKEVNWMWKTSDASAFFVKRIVSLMKGTITYEWRLLILQ